MLKFLSAIVLSVGVCIFTTAASADNWVAQKLRGGASVMVNGEWTPLKRGDTVSTSALVRTMKDGQIEFIRDHETITLEPNTQIQIFDRVGQRYTTVKEAFGSVRVEANVENVKHFSVQTPFVAATVKGTIFTVVSHAGKSKVLVQRGKVGVNDLHHGLHVDVRAGQNASAGNNTPLQIAGAGKRAVVVNAAGKPVAGAKVSDKEHKINSKKASAESKKNNRGGDNKKVSGISNVKGSQQISMTASGLANGGGGSKGNGDGAKSNGNGKSNANGSAGGSAQVNSSGNTNSGGNGGGNSNGQSNNGNGNGNGNGKSK